MMATQELFVERATTVFARVFNNKSLLKSERAVALFVGCCIFWLTVITRATPVHFRLQRYPMATVAAI